MPVSPAHFVAALEAAFVLAGAVLLWRLGLSPTARHTPASVALATWDAATTDFLLFLWFLIMGGIFVQVFTAPFIRHLGLTADEKLTLIGTTVHLGGLLGVALIARFLRYSAPRPTRKTTNAFLSGLVTFLIAMPVIYAVGLLWQGALHLCGIPVENQPLVDAMRHSTSTAFKVFMILAASVVVPVTEEYFFRAGIFRFARTRLPRWAALLAPACLFSALHGSLAFFAPLVALGVIFSLAYERTGRIGTSIVAHGLFNLNSVVLILAGVNDQA